MVFGLYPDFWKHLLGKPSFFVQGSESNFSWGDAIYFQPISFNKRLKEGVFITYVSSYIHCRQKYGKIGNMFDMFDLQEMDWYHPQTSIVTIMHPTHVVLWTKNAIGNVRNWRYKIQCTWMYHFFNDSPKMSHISQGIHVITLWIYENFVCIL